MLLPFRMEPLYRHLENQRREKSTCAQHRKSSHPETRSPGEPQKEWGRKKKPSKQQANKHQHSRMARGELPVALNIILTETAREPRQPGYLQITCKVLWPVCVKAELRFDTVLLESQLWCWHVLTEPECYNHHMHEYSTTEYFHTTSLSRLILKKKNSEHLSHVQVRPINSTRTTWTIDRSIISH